MSRRALLSNTTLEAFFHIPADVDELRRHYLLSSAELDLIRTRRRDKNRFGLAVHLALLRHPGQGWLEGTVLPSPFIDWLGEQLHLPSDVLTGYVGRGATRTAHHMLAMRHLDLTPFTQGHAELATHIATTSAVVTDKESTPKRGAIAFSG